MKKLGKGILLLLYTIILLMAGIYLIDKSSSNEIEFNFFIEGTKETLSGEIIANNISLGEVKHGSIILPRNNLNFSSFTFKVFYNNYIHSIEYDFNENYKQYKSINFLVSQEQLDSRVYVLGNRSIEIYFYDNKTRCNLNGNIYFNDNLIGKSFNGKFVLSEEIYNKYFKINSSMYIFGITDSCFGDNIDLPFASYWDIYSLNEYFITNKTLILNPSLNPRQPNFEIEMQAFIRPNDVSFYLSELNKYADSGSIEENLDAIARYYISYQTDKIQFNQEEYWQTPVETLRNKKGDCEDWAVTTLSLMRAYNPEIHCYNALWPEHISVFCYFDNKFIIYDQNKVKSRTSLNLEIDRKIREIVNQENRIALRNMLNRYFESYGLRVKDRRLIAIFNEKEIVKFQDNENFIDWAVNLVQKD